jgi:hypothetical protein
MTWSHTLATAPGRVAESLSRAAADAVRPRININTVVLNTVDDAHKASKLIVYEAKMNVDVTREESSSSWGMYWGTNTARVVARDAHVQYAIDLSTLGTSNFQYDTSANELTVYLPRPHLDTSMVAIDPGRIDTLDLRGGWARFNKTDTREHAIAELRPALINQAQAPFLKELAGNAGLEAAHDFLKPLAESLARDGTKVRIAYTE